MPGHKTAPWILVEWMNQHASCWPWYHPRVSPRGQFLQSTVPSIPLHSEAFFLTSPSPPPVPDIALVPYPALSGGCITQKLYTVQSPAELWKAPPLL